MEENQEGGYSAVPSSAEEAPTDTDTVGTGEIAPFRSKKLDASKSFHVRNPDMGEILAKIHALNDDLLSEFIKNMEKAGYEAPVDEGGNKTVTYYYLDGVPFNTVNLAYVRTVTPMEAEQIELEETPTLFRPPPEMLEPPSPKKVSLERSPSPVTQNKTSTQGDKKSFDSELEGSGSGGEELYLTEKQKEMFHEKLKDMGYHVPRDRNGKLKYTRGLVDGFPDDIANEILDTVDANFDDSSSSQESERRQSVRVSLPTLKLGLRRSRGINYVTNERGEKLAYPEMAELLKQAFSDAQISKQEEQNKDREAHVRQAIREERRREQELDDRSFRRTESVIKMHELAMRYIPTLNVSPVETDPIELMDVTGSLKREDGQGATTNTVRIEEAPPMKGLDFVHIYAQRGEFGLRQIDSFATLASTMERKISMATMRGSMLSTHLSDMPSTFSQALLDELSEAVLSPSVQAFDITPESTRKFMHSWLIDYMSGFAPRNTFTIRIINMISQREVELRVLKHYTMNQVCHLYMQYEDHPEYYVWKDIYGRILSPTKTMVENGLVRQDEILEFQGYRRLPVVLLYFRDGFENDPPLPLNPLHSMKAREPGLCRNY